MRWKLREKRLVCYIPFVLEVEATILQDTPVRASGLEDRELLLIKSGDRAAIGRLFAQTARELYEVLMREWRDASLADDAVQHAFERLLEDPLSVRASNMRELRSWLFAVARNYLKDRAKVGNGKWTVPISALDQSADESGQEDGNYLESIADSAPTVEQMIEYADRSETIRLLLTESGSPCREILSLFYLTGLDLTEVSKQVGLTLDQVKKRKSGCLARLAEVARAKGILSTNDI